MTYAQRAPLPSPPRRVGSQPLGWRVLLLPHTNGNEVPVTLASPGRARVEFARPELELLVCCARTTLEAEQTDRIRELVRRGLDWTYLLPAADRHALLPLLYWNLNATCPLSVPQFWLGFLRERFEEIARRNLYLTWELHRILKLFEANEIGAAPYKGPVLAACTYGNLALRQFLDLDLLIRQKDVARAQELLETLGFRPQTSVPATRDGSSFQAPGQYLLRREPEKTIVELHSERTLRYFPIPLDFERMWTRLESVSVGGTEIRTVSTRDLLPLLCVHGTKHFWERLIWVCDVAELLRVYREAHWGQILEQAQSSGSDRMLFLGLRLARQLLGVALPKELAEKVQAEPMLDSLTTQVCRQQFGETQDGAGALSRFLFRVKTRPRLKQGLRYALRLATTPTEEDWGTSPSTGRFSSLASALRRSVRLLRKYGLGVLRPAARADLGGFEPTPVEVVERLLAFAEVGPADLLFDLGCGDGRIVVLAAKNYQVRGVGVDVDASRIAEAKARARAEGVWGLVRFVQSDAKSVDVSRATLVTLYLPWASTLTLRAILQDRLPDGARIVSLDAGMGDWLPDKTDILQDATGRTRTLYLWRIAKSPRRASP